MDNQKLLNDLYYKKLNYDGVTELTRKAKLINKDITHKEVKDFLQKQSVHQQTTVDKVGERDLLPIYAEDHNAYQIDLTFLPKYRKKNDGYHVLFTAIKNSTRK